MTDDNIQCTRGDKIHKDVIANGMLLVELKVKQEGIEKRLDGIEVLVKRFIMAIVFGGGTAFGIAKYLV